MYGSPTGSADVGARRAACRQRENTARAGPAAWLAISSEPAESPPHQRGGGAPGGQSPGVSCHASIWSHSGGLLNIIMHGVVFAA